MASHRHQTCACSYLKDTSPSPPTFFWPRGLDKQGSTVELESTDDKNNSDLPNWPHLQEFLIDLGAVAPSGSWLFDGDPEDSRPSSPSLPSDDSDSNSDVDPNDSDNPDLYNETVEEVACGILPGLGISN